MRTGGSCYEKAKGADVADVDRTRVLCRDCCAVTATDAGVCVDCGGNRLVAHPEIETLGIAHIDCDAFYASVEKRDRPEIRRQPLIVGHPGGRGVVTTACYIARRCDADVQGS